MNTFEKINVNLYGGKGIFGGKEVPLEADTIYCSNTDSCSLYKEGKCLKCRAVFCSNKCPYGNCNTARGYTSRAAKYYDFKKMYTEDPCYGKLNYPSSATFAVIGDYYWFCLAFASINFDKEVNKYIIRTSVGADRSFFIPKADLTAELLDKLFKSDPRTFFDYEKIKDYSEKQVPNAVHSIKRLAPDLYKQLCDLDPKYTEFVPNYIGKWAYLVTLKEGSVVKDCHGNEYTLTKDSKGNIMLKGTMTHYPPFDGESAYIEIKPRATKTIKIEDNSWCDENTKFD